MTISNTRQKNRRHRALPEPSRDRQRRTATATWLTILMATIMLPAATGLGATAASGAAGRSYSGSASCRECHEKFYRLWEPSHHGKAMQPVTAAWAKARLTPLPEAITVKDRRYTVDLDELTVKESGPAGIRQYRLLHVVGGKNVCFFLTPLDRGRLQVLPLAYDVRRRAWYGTTGSMVRHFAEDDTPLDWQDPMLTFNTACHSCHVSQLAKNYDAANNTYHTTWREPGINCETCHGPASEHVRVCREAAPGTVPADLRIVSMKPAAMTKTQRDAVCAPCHAKMRPLTDSFPPGARYFDHFDLVTLENSDFSPDGRDLGENYTYTLWRLNPCAKTGQLECLHCHTSSGRFRFRETPTDACLPCHAERVKKLAAHSHHKPGPKAPNCISCHMPMTEFSRMRRSDHSLRPPSPAASMRFKSPNACNVCHDDRTPEWAAAKVREWHPEGPWRKRIIEAGELVAAARAQHWDRLPAMVSYVQRNDREEVVAASLLRLLARCGDPGKWPAIAAGATAASPLVRAAAIEAIGDETAGGGAATERALKLLLSAAGDDRRVVRVTAAAYLAHLPDDLVPAPRKAVVERAFAQYRQSLLAYPDRWASHYNLGNFVAARAMPAAALKEYARASFLRPDVVPPKVNAALLLAQLGRLGEGETLLREALRLEPANAAVNFNLALAVAERGDRDEAEERLRTALKTDPRMAAAAYNLGVLLSDEQPEEALGWCRRAASLEPDNGKYVYTLAFYLARRGEVEEAAGVLRTCVEGGHADADVILLLGQLDEGAQRYREAGELYNRVLENPATPPDAKAEANRRLQSLPHR